MAETLKIALAQIAPTVGDLDGNKALIRDARRQAAEQGADLVVFPELIVSGYPPEDLVLKPAYQRACREAAEELAQDTGDGGPAMIIGAPWPQTERGGGKAWNAAILCDEGLIQRIVYKTRLPNYSVFDEPRRYRTGESVTVTEWRGMKLGLMICEDMWYPDAAQELKAQGAEIFIVPHGSPFRTTCHAERLTTAEARMEETGLPLIFVNQVGGQDELLFDGSSFAGNCQNDRVQAPCFETGVFMTGWERRAGKWKCTDGPMVAWPTGHELTYPALVTGVRDYVNKNRFPGVVIGLSGGIDSALTAAIAVDALGPERVRCVMMPSRYTAGDSLTDAEKCAEALGVSYESIAIEPAVKAFDEMLGETFAGREPDTTEENLQSRIRGVILMALSNKFGPMVLTTGNKSEMSVGYATLYGDMNGGYNPLKDVYKTDVFALARWRNTKVPRGCLGPPGEVIPVNIIDKPPSAELRAGQRDDDSLPPYEILDAILTCLVEEEMAVRDIIAEGHDEETVRRIQHLLYVAEYKRRQSPPGPKITTRNFGRDRRYPIVNGFRDR
ncbi:NAD+ synthase [Aquisalinus flavus]|uniref:Glutamine-dependent NAD(+) synthetase n=1 Tax=Aquisalinus flavus TaxID=1526572 RepID=A0A8J2Y2Z8_9PROT|nr:NAD+ synthase [Aquisalinus flavus]MBD0426923.1 NAD+ synthase [Aquisalinus flavus]UNE46766.1 NAD+ synthase [Aquisalinus flavus]GGC97007.1 NAD+ synthase [Aquisalinus flavus]